MDVLCTDKTGTLTEGVVQPEGAYDDAGQPSADVLELGACNAALETGVTSPLDEAITSAHTPDLTHLRKLGEIPFDFVRKRVTVVVRTADGARLIAKGAFHHVLEICTHLADGSILDPAAHQQLERRYEEWAARGIRVLAVAARSVDEKTVYGRDDECDMTFIGFLTFLDRPKQGVADTLNELAALGVSVKLVTGDSSVVAQHVATLVGMRADRVLTGRQLAALKDEALWRVAETTDLFVEVDPNQKERISLLVPFLPLTAGQILLNNFLSDVPAIGSANDSVDRELVERPRRWDIRFIGRYMVEFGILSSVFDFIMFGALLTVFRAAPETFRTGWFVESLLIELVVALVMRTQRPFFRSRPGNLLLISTLVLIVVAFAIPYLPFAGIFGFVRLPGPLLGTIALITALYVGATELQKKWFYRNATAGPRARAA
jgi:magnesium-transporting ATPase (P-type)